MGAQDAQDAVKKGKGVSVDHLIHYHALKKTGDTRINEMTLENFIAAKSSGFFEEHKDASFLKEMLSQ